MITELEHCYRQLLIHIGEDPDREGLRKTPQRAAKSLEFLTQGYRDDLDKRINGALYSTQHSELITLKNIEFYSLCEHHLLPFVGQCHISYVADKKVMGLSKLARIVDHFARRLQMQEHLTQQIADCLLAYTMAKGVGVMIEAQHFCMMMRGVGKQNAVLQTIAMRGIFDQDEAMRNAFLTTVKSEAHPCCPLTNRVTPDSDRGK